MSRYIQPIKASVIYLIHLAIDLMQETDRTVLRFDRFKRFPWKGLRDAQKTMTMKVNGKAKDIVIQGDILGLTVTDSFKETELIDVDGILDYILAPMSLSVATSGGYGREMVKIKFCDTVSSREGLSVSIEWIRTEKFMALLIYQHT